jgi:hypothetical protein
MSWKIARGNLVLRELRDKEMEIESRLDETRRLIYSTNDRVQ